MRRLFFYIAIVIVTLSAGCQRSYIPGEVRWEQRGIDDQITGDSSMQELVKPYKQSLADEMEEVIGQLDTPLYHQHPEEMEEYTGSAPDFALHNYGGIRLEVLPEGPVTVGRIYEILPFDNALVDLSADSATVDTLVEHFMERGGWPLSRGIDIRCSDSGYTVDIAGKPLSGDRIYHIAMPDYIANGGDDCAFLKDNPRISTGYFVRDLMVEYIREETAEGMTIKAPGNRRIHCDEKEMR